ncbi:hypothetical protein CBR_g10770 [Chara braunii]|uniref:Uncharacterized protein n=1 Tax=Chara braunii TaxID=69332 RepID=A0A388KP39_CHABU|nr:hypothetical protein CBR_g10770 [Chara braunii]|eukprot:GBG71830.1 hypothetical protein CBR_g10770 [Chara braunii]
MLPGIIYWRKHSSIHRTAMTSSVEDIVNSMVISKCADCVVQTMMLTCIRRRLVRLSKVAPKLRSQEEDGAQSIFLNLRTRLKPKITQQIKFGIKKLKSQCQISKNQLHLAHGSRHGHE